MNRTMEAVSSGEMAALNRAFESAEKAGHAPVASLWNDPLAGASIAVVTWAWGISLRLDFRDVRGMQDPVELPLTLPDVCSVNGATYDGWRVRWNTEYGELLHEPCRPFAETQLERLHPACRGFRPVSHAKVYSAQRLMRSVRTGTDYKEGVLAEFQMGLTETASWYVVQKRFAAVYLSSKSDGGSNYMILEEAQLTALRKVKQDEGMLVRWKNGDAEEIDFRCGRWAFWSKYRYPEGTKTLRDLSRKLPFAAWAEESLVMHSFTPNAKDFLKFLKRPLFKTAERIQIVLNPSANGIDVHHGEYVRRFECSISTRVAVRFEVGRDELIHLIDVAGADVPFPRVSVHGGGEQRFLMAAEACIAANVVKS